MKRSSKIRGCRRGASMLFYSAALPVSRQTHGPAHTPPSQVLPRELSLEPKVPECGSALVGQLSAGRHALRVRRNRRRVAQRSDRRFSVAGRLAWGVNLGVRDPAIWDALDGTCAGAAGGRRNMTAIRPPRPLVSPGTLSDTQDAQVAA